MGKLYNTPTKHLLSPLDQHFLILICYKAYTIRKITKCTTIFTNHHSFQIAPIAYYYMILIFGTKFQSVSEFYWSPESENRGPWILTKFI
jgi:hypothetical protein